MKRMAHRIAGAHARWSGEIVATQEQRSCARCHSLVEGGCTGSSLTIRVNLYVLEVDVADGATQARILATITVGWWTHTAVPVRNR